MPRFRDPDHDRRPTRRTASGFRLRVLGFLGSKFMPLGLSGLRLRVRVFIGQLLQLRAQDFSVLGFKVYRVGGWV